MKSVRIGSWAVTALAAALAWAAIAVAEVSPADKCEAGKHAAIGKYADCLHDALAKLTKTGDTGKYGENVARCGHKLTDRWDMLEARATASGGTCPTTVDSAGLMEFEAKNADIVAAALAGAGLAVCGNGVVESGEDCDWSDLDGATCSSASGGYLPLGELKCRPVTCTFDTSDCFEGCGGAVIEGKCWLLAEFHEDCVTECAEHQMAYDEATRTYAGSDGTITGCELVLTMLGLPPPPAVTDYDAGVPPEGLDFGIGCGFNVVTGERARVFNPPTTATGIALESIHFMRACACRNPY